MIDTDVNRLINELDAIPRQPTSTAHAAEWAGYHAGRAAFWKSAAQLLVVATNANDKRFIAATIARRLELEK